MRKPALGLPSPAMVVAVVALFMALGGTGYAASTLTASAAKKPKHADASQDLKQIKSFFNSHKASLIGPAGPRGLQGIQGTQGVQGVTGNTGGRGPSDGFVVQDGTIAASKTTSLVLPAGQFIVTGTMPASNGNNATETINSCALTSTADPGHAQNLYQSLPANGGAGFTYGTLTGTTAQNLPAGGTVTLACPAVAGITYGPSTISAVQVGTLHG
jgi:hypothetical protein